MGYRTHSSTGLRDDVPVSLPILRVEQDQVPS
ncbi:hypothetical protein Ae505Ps2_2400c [Pseudonocardia sp. Ae505_Ps2]|nr:hypothetical protein Ae505Ps2_2400c [Pseudonocardia sp. Ae505_Ps2]